MHIEHIKSFLNDIFKHLGIKPESSVEEVEEKTYKVTISGNDLSFLIGFRGQSLEALQSILSLMALRKVGEPVSVILDINGYRDQKAERIINLTKSFIDKVRFFQKEVQLPMMNPWERRQVHILVAEYDDVISESTGEGPARRVVLKPKN
jgi:spoIIIJ-associated protein